MTSEVPPMLHPVLKDVESSALAWINPILVENGFDPSDHLIAVNERPWSLVAKVPNAPWFFKCLPWQFAHELPVSDWLSGRFPKWVAQVVAVNLDQRFMLVADAGPTLRDQFEQGAKADVWLEQLGHYSRIQIESASENTLTKTGLPDRSVEQLPKLVMPLAKLALTVKTEDPEDEFNDEHFETLTQALTHWTEWSRPLSNGVIPNAISHGDLHDGNLARVIFDWGDASWTHPFTSLRTTLDNIKNRFKLTDSQLDVYLQAYLQPWKDHLKGKISADEIAEQVTLAQTVAPLVSLLSWYHAIQNTEDPRTHEFQFALASLCREFVDNYRQLNYVPGNA